MEMPVFVCSIDISGRFNSLYSTVNNEVTTCPEDALDEGVWRDHLSCRFNGDEDGDPSGCHIHAAFRCGYRGYSSARVDPDHHRSISAVRRQALCRQEIVCIRIGGPQGFAKDGMMALHQDQSTNDNRTPRHNSLAVFSGGTIIGVLGGLIGLGGAEFRLPLLIGVFGFGALEAVMLNKAMSLVVVASALPFRAAAVPFSSVLQRYDVLVTLLSGSIVGAWLGASWAIRLRSQRLYRVIAVLLVGIAAVLLWGHGMSAGSAPLFHGWLLTSVGVAAGVGIGIVAALLGVAGGELLIPTVMLLFGADLKLAGSISLAVSLPTMITSFTRYSRDRSFAVIRTERRFIMIMAAGSVGGAYVGGRLLGIVPTPVLLPLLAVILVISAVKVWRHK